MSKDKVIATVSDGLITEFDKQLLPLYLLRTKDVKAWLEARAIDPHRTNSRLLKRALRLINLDDVETVLSVNAATITDTYWFKKIGSNLKYDNVRFKVNAFDKLALYGDPDSFNNEGSPTPELTNTGSFEKCWRLIDGKWWIFKKGDDLQRFSEKFIYELGYELGFSMAEYQLDDKYIKSIDFTNGADVNFDAMIGIVGEDEDYLVNFNELEKLSPMASKQYVAMVYLDALCFNMDRHTQNYGVLRNVETGEIISLAPLFDHNIALISNGYPKNISRENDKLIKMFINFLKACPKASNYYKNLNIPKIDEALIARCINKVGIRIDNLFITKFVLNAQDIIDKNLHLQRTKSNSDLSR